MVNRAPPPPWAPRSGQAAKGVSDYSPTLAVIARELKAVGARLKVRAGPPTQPTPAAGGAKPAPPVTALGPPKRGGELAGCPGRGVR